MTTEPGPASRSTPRAGGGWLFAPFEDAGILIPRRGPRLTLLAIAYGAGVLFWLSTEDSTVWPVVALSGGLSALLITLSAVGHLAGRRLSRRGIVLVTGGLGGLAGALTGLITALLMLIKTAMHAHAYPDYPLTLMGAALARIPGWSLVGFFLGVGTALAWLAYRGR